MTTTPSPASGHPVALDEYGWLKSIAAGFVVAGCAVVLGFAVFYGLGSYLSAPWAWFFGLATTVLLGAAAESRICRGASFQERFPILFTLGLVLIVGNVVGFGDMKGGIVKRAYKAIAEVAPASPWLAELARYRQGTLAQDWEIETRLKAAGLGDILDNPSRVAGLEVMESLVAFKSLPLTPAMGARVEAIATAGVLTRADRLELTQYALSLPASPEQSVALAKLDDTDRSPRRL